MPARTLSLPRILARALITAAVLTSGHAPAAGAWPLNGAPISTGALSQTDPVIVTGLDGGAIIVWTDTRYGGPNIFAQRVDSTGATLWSTDGVAVCTEIHDQSQPAAVASFGGVAIVWQDRRLMPAVFAQVLDANGVAQLAPDGIKVHEFRDERPVIISDGVFSIGVPFGYIAGWIVSNPIQVMFQHFDATGGGMWPGVGTSIGATSIPTSMAMVTDGVGGLGTRKGAVVTWDARVTNDDVFAARLRGDDGTVLWSTPVAAIIGNQYGARIANVGASSYVIAWSDERAVDADLYCQKLNSAGTAQWVANGLPICRAAGTQEDMRIVSDGAGGFYATWTDRRSGGPKVYAHRLDGNGQPLWSLDGVAVCAADGDQSHPTLLAAPDGVLVAWQDGRLGTSNIYVQKLDPAGNLIWSSYGVPLSRTAPGALGPAAVTDGAYGGVFAWSDVRSGDANVYAMRAWPSGVLAAPESPPGRFGLSFVSANPAKGEVRMRLELPAAVPVRIDVVDAAGRIVRRVPEQAFDAGVHAIQWDGNGDSGAAATPGVYFVRVHAGAGTAVARAVRLR